MICSWLSFFVSHCMLRAISADNEYNFLIFRPLSSLQTTRSRWLWQGRSCVWRLKHNSATISATKYQIPSTQQLRNFFFKERKPIWIDERLFLPLSLKILLAFKHFQEEDLHPFWLNIKCNE